MRGKRLVNWLAALFASVLGCIALAAPAKAEDGYGLWLRYAPPEGEAKAELSRHPIVLATNSQQDNPTIAVAMAELERGLESLSGLDVDRRASVPTSSLSDVTLISLQCDHPQIAGGGAFSLNSSSSKVSILASEPIGCLYGAFALLRSLSEGEPLDSIAYSSAPAMPLRMLNHWDNPDGHVERGYAGRSIFDWWHLPERLDQRMIDYARANASIGINGVVVNNVNARAFMLEQRYIAKYKRLADAWRPFGIRLYVSARFSAPQDIGGLNTSDPLDPAVRAWWKAKADEFYRAVPDFGGFLVKANSEGQPGPQDFGRTHADGANMLAEAVGNRGTVIWRAFVYSEEDETDRAKQAYAEFVPLDGQFADNVIIQVKNGPIDFQPREPYHPMFGAMPNTNLMLEAQITKEYLGFASHLAFLAPMWEEVLDEQTGRAGTVAEVVSPVGMAGVANTGSDRNWTGSHFDQANWYAFGRLAWDPDLSSEHIAREWASQTFTRDPQANDAIVAMMMRSREAVVSYMTPLGLAHLMDTGHHYGPAPWVCDLARPEWNPCYYHRADAEGIGFDRTVHGSDALSQYPDEIAERWDDPATIDPRFLLWFHHVAWDAKLSSGETLWEALVAEYDRGVEEVDAMARQWAELSDAIDPQRFRAVSESLEIQCKEARWWRDASIAYWQSINGLPVPNGARQPAETIEAYQSRSFPEAPGQ
ncbi:alpha-glucuronidase [Altererythrobacter aurantiacus]|uniref:Xylan alpha-1,2-glucuronidase n=1 Tax=Parapontixanthobacter aurantiacus TaxID=1463599 RepID=A0A844ZBD8_9SPHN|nr:alpha-glucuronidase family glycosyl hydrolase [Parapontixanthobacter aurantiacus]MXO85851.1 alpha-glucuronidase [Parapontixanthobacter aurantiacus]